MAKIPRRLKRLNAIRQPDATAIAIAGDRIVYVGDDAGAAAYQGDGTRVAKLRGETVVPGFIDAHTHLAWSGAENLDVQLADAETVDDLLAAITAGAAASPRARWVRGGGWDLSRFDGKIDRTTLDAIVPDRPVYMSDADSHSAWVNSRALDLAGIGPETPDPVGGIIDRDAAGAPTGLLRENAMALVGDLLPAYPREQEDHGLADALAEANADGITTIIDPNVDRSTLATYRRLDHAGGLSVRVRGAVEVDGPDAASRRTAFRLRRRYHGDHLAVNAVKVYLDGVIETETAYMLAPYVDGTNGIAQFTDDSLRQTLLPFDRAGFQVHAHAIGDAAVRQLLDAVEWLATEDGPRDRRPLLAHIQVIEPEDIGRFASLGAYADFQPLWAYPDPYITDLTIPVLGPERSRWLYPIEAVRAAGGTIVAGSDWSVSSMSVLEAMEVAVTRQDPDVPGEVLTPEHRVTATQILRAYTADGARAVFLEDEIGTVSVGKRADLVVLGADPLAVEPHAISEIEVMATWFDGRQVYASPSTVYR